MNLKKIISLSIVSAALSFFGVSFPASAAIPDCQFPTTLQFVSTNPLIGAGYWVDQPQTNVDLIDTDTSTILSCRNKAENAGYDCYQFTTNYNGAIPNGTRSCYGGVQ